MRSSTLSVSEQQLRLARRFGDRSFHDVARGRGLRPNVLVAFLGLALLAPVAAESHSLETFVFAAGGQSSATFDPPCTGGGSPSPVYDFFGVWGLGIPTAGLDLCNVAGGVDDLTSLTGPLPGSRTVSSSWPAIPTNTFSGSSAATSNYGRLSAQGHAQFSGDFTNLNVTGAEGFGLAREGFTITSPSIPNGQPGTILFRVTVSGSFSLTNNSWAGVQLTNRVNAGNSYYLLSSYVFYPTENPNLSSHDGGGLGGFTLSPGAMSGSGEVASAVTPIVFGTSFDYSLGLLAYAVSSRSSVVDSHFEAAITGIEVRDSNGQLVNNFVVASASGTSYGPSGTTAVDALAPPELGGFAQLTAFPNPAGARLQLRFSLSRPATTSLDVYDSSGRRVRELEHAVESLGDRSVAWDGRDDRGSLVPAGLYFARLSSREGSVTTRLMLLR